MLLKRFYINIIVRITLILGTMVFQAFAFNDLIEKQLLFTFIVLSVFLLIQVILLFSYLRKSNRLLTKFVLAISNREFTWKFSQEAGKTPYKDLNKAFNTIIEQYQSVSLEKESQSFLLHHLIRDIPAGILVADQEGRILLKNNALDDLLSLADIHSLEEVEIRQPDFYNRILRSGISGKHIYELSAPKEIKKFSVTVDTFLLLNNLHKLILVQDISKEVEASEVDAIQRLLRILTHEIMNSLAPVNSLTETITMLMTDESGRPKLQENLSQRNYNDILESVQAIMERTMGMDHFVNTFRTLTELPETLETELTLVKELLESVCKIMHAQLANVPVIIDLESEAMKIDVDSALIEQVFINLVTNSLTALSDEENPQLVLKAFHKDDQVIIQVEDNGIGIPREKLANIFMPFYSTKEKASGIGLSFVKQILRLHNASVHVQSVVNEGSIFSISFQDRY